MNRVALPLTSTRLTRNTPRSRLNLLSAVFATAVILARPDSLPATTR
jgi:hypothetical protein